MWEAVYWPVLIVVAGSMLVNIAALWAGRWGKASLLARLHFDAVSVWILIYLLRASELVTLEITGDPQLDRVSDGITIAVRVLLGFVLILTLVDLWKYGRMAFRLFARGR